MKPLTREWVSKAEGDFATAERELDVRGNPNYDAACFHTQQCVEKYLKALLQERDIPFGRTHNLVALLDLLPGTPELEEFRGDLHALTAYAVEFRYPGEFASKELAADAVARCRTIRQAIRTQLSLS